MCGSYPEQWKSDWFAPSRRAAVEEVLRSREVFVEDLFDLLLDRLGFPPAVEPGGDG